MPVEKSRHWTQKPNALGVQTEWTCPACSEKVTGRTLEQGCPHCGTGVGQEPDPTRVLTVDETAPADARLLARGRFTPQPRRDGPVEEHVDDSPLVFGEQPGHPEAQTPRPMVGPSARQHHFVTGMSVASEGTKTYRVIEYTCKPGQEAAMEQTLQRSLVGKVGFAWGTIVAAIVDEVSERQMDVLGLMRRQPGVWLGGPRREDLFPMQVADVETMIKRAQAHDIARRESEARLMADVTPPPGPPSDPRGPAATPILPDQGPAYTRMDEQLAQVIAKQCGLQVAYTIALALQNYAELANMEALEPEKILTGERCLALASALMQQIPEHWAPEPEGAQDGTDQRRDTRTEEGHG